MFKNNAMVLGFDVCSAEVDDLVLEVLKSDSATVINTINPHSYVVQKSDEAFRASLKESDFLLPDGSGMVLAAKFLVGVKLKKIAGYDLFQSVMSQLDAVSGSVFFLGSSPKVLELIIARCNVEFQNVTVETLSPPYKAAFDVNDVKLMASKINDLNPDVLFVGLTAPKQEKLISLIRSELNVKLVSGVGAVFDFYAGTVVRPSDIWIQLHLEWLVRLIGEPRRLWRRNFISTPIFLFDLFKAKLFG